MMGKKWLIYKWFIRTCVFLFLGLLMMISGLSVRGQAATEQPPRLESPRPEPTTLPDHYPQYTDIYVNDFAGIISDANEQDLRQRLEVLWDSGVETVVVTVNSYTDYGTNATSFEDFVTHLFNYWGVGDSDSDGVMILVAVKDRKVRIEVGSSYESTQNSAMQGVINEFMLPRFRQNDYEGGIIDGSEAVIRILSGETDTDVTPVDFPSPVYQGSSSYTSTNYGSSNNLGWGGIAVGAAGIAGVGGLGFTAFRRYSRLRPRNCPSCGHAMNRLDEVADDEFLDDGQRREEALQSVDYDVWKCTSCNTHQVFAYGAMMSGYRECVQCHYRTMGTHSRVIDGADCYSSGLREVTHSCDNCGYRRTFEETIPRKDCTDHSSSHSSSSSSSHSSGSFGGGHSSGGGASGSW
ncbi:MAG TPA: TPM domain-containing protein [Phototrophicaceae bacterium]|jgi:uncharacterized protein|nr:TPM domain-containing protein [Phototrophicaceae bacterium]